MHISITYKSNLGRICIGLRELVAANPDNTHLETQVKTKEVKKSVDEQGLSGLNSLLTRPPDSLHAEPQEEFYDALMVEYPDEDEDDAARSMLSKQRVGDKLPEYFFYITPIKLFIKLIIVNESYSTRRF